MISSPIKRVEDLSLAQRERLAYIDFLLYFFGDIGRPDLIERFGVAPAGATRDLALYREIAPQNIEFDVPCESPVALSCPQMDVLAPICRAIHAKRPVAIRYHSMSSGETERIIVPFALVDTGLRWHVRAFDRKSGEFRDFVVTRIEAPILLDEEPKANERPDNDIQWTRIVELDLVPHPRFERPEVIKMDYGMVGGSIRMRVRAAVAGYMLLRWNVDASPDHSLKEEQYRLWLSDSLALYGVENAKLAPGYHAPNGRT